MRCPNCSKFVPFDEPEVEVNDESVNTTDLSVGVRIVLKCADCGEELKDAELTDDLDLNEEHECPDSEKQDKMRDDGEDLFELEGSLEAEGFDRYQDKDRHGKPIKSRRYQRHFYGANVTGQAKCLCCEEIFDVKLTLEEQASGFNELV
jgi:hypothetical protein